jgi:hypothetical protein
MKRFKDQRTLEVYQTRFAVGVPSHVSSDAHEMLRVLVAAYGLEDVGVLGPVLRWRNAPKRLGLQIYGKWHVTFLWSEGFGAYEIWLQRR